MEDDEIVSLYIARSEKAITETAEKYGKRLQALSFRIVQDLQTSEECVSDTYLEAWNAIPPHEPRSYFYAFLARITRHISLNCCRDRSRLKRYAHICQLSSELEQCISAPDDLQCHMDELALKEILNRFIEELKPNKRYIFIRRYWYLDSVEEIAKQCSISQSKVKTTLFRCRNQLREKLIKEGYEL